MPISSVTFQYVVNLLEVLLVVSALLTTTSDTIREAIVYYQWQSVLLAVVTTATVVSRVSGVESQPGANVGVLILFIALLPLVLAGAIRPLLYRATLEREPASTMDDMNIMLALLLSPWMKAYGRLRTLPGMGWPRRTEEPHGIPGRHAARMQRYEMMARNAEVEWQRRQSMHKGLASLLLFLVLLLVALLIPFSIPIEDSDLSQRIGLSVSLALHLIGLYNMVIKRDIISQVIGLLIMDHGLYLAVVKIVAIPVPAGLFVLSLYFYTLITIFILVILIPQVRAKTGSIDLNRIAESSDLRSKAGS